MFKSYFTVGFHQQGREEFTLITGVSSIVPNLNGVLFFLYNGNTYQVESYMMNESSGSLQLFIDYNDDWLVDELSSDPKCKKVVHGI